MFVSRVYPRLTTLAVTEVKTLPLKLSGHINTFSTGSKYFLKPWPAYTRHDMQNWASGRRHRNRPGLTPLGHRMNPYEREAVGTAKRLGYLQLKQYCEVSACNEYYHYCFATRRPYMALNKHGDEICIDLTAAAGPGKDEKADEMAVDRLREEFWKVLSSFNSDILVHPREITHDINTAREQGLEGSSVGKQTADSTSVTYFVQTSKRNTSLRLARKLFYAYCKVMDKPTQREMYLQRMEHKQRRQNLKQKAVHRRAVKLASAPRRHPNVPPGSMTEFARQELGIEHPFPQSKRS